MQNSTRLNQVKEFLKIFNCKGSYTLESTVILPTVLLLLFGLIYFSLSVYQKVVVIDAATYSATQRAATWDNSARDLQSGQLNDQTFTDGLYWRLFRDYENTALTTSKKIEAESLIAQKLSTGVLTVRDQEVEVSYHRGPVNRTVQVDIDQNLVLPPWIEKLIGLDINNVAKAEVTEPTEYIRNIDVLTDYLGEINQYIDNFRQGRQEPEKSTKVYVTKRKYEDKVYHTNPNCQHVKNITRHGNLTTIGTKEEAQTGGYRVCKVCSASH